MKKIRSNNVIVEETRYPKLRINEKLKGEKEVPLLVSRQKRNKTKKGNGQVVTAWKTRKFKPSSFL